MKTTALLKTLRAIQEMILTGELIAAGEFPSVRNLAKRIPVSHPTVLKTCRFLQSKGLLIIRQGAINRLCDDAAAIDSFAQSDLRLLIQEHLPRHAAQEKINHDLTLGTYGNAKVLPPFKDLSARYGICYRTLKSALDELVDNKRLEHFGKRYRTPKIGPDNIREMVILFSRGVESGELTFFNQRDSEDYRSFTTECSKYGIQLLVISCFFIMGSPRMRYDGQDRECFGPLAANDDRILGFVLWKSYLQDDLYSLLINTLPRLCRPISVLGGEQPSKKVTVDENGCIIRYFQIAESDHPGRHAGAHLHMLGHRRIAYFTFDAESEWSKNRVAGITAAFGSDNHPETVRVYGGKWAHDYHDTISKTRQILSGIRTATAGALSTFGSDPGLQIEVSNKMLALFFDKFFIEALRVKAAPFFSNALACPEITAWVGSGDLMAITALGYLNKNGVPVPGRISVMGFDDSLDASYIRLTSYNFGGEIVMKEMIAHLLYPSRSLELRHRPGSGESPGFVTVRETTGVAGDQYKSK